MNWFRFRRFTRDSPWIQIRMRYNYNKNRHRSSSFIFTALQSLKQPTVIILLNNRSLFSPSSLNCAEMQIQIPNPINPLQHSLGLIPYLIRHWSKSLALIISIILNSILSNKIILLLGNLFTTNILYHLMILIIGKSTLTLLNTILLNDLIHDYINKLKSQLFESLVYNNNSTVSYSSIYNDISDYKNNVKHIILHSLKLITNTLVSMHSLFHINAHLTWTLLKSVPLVYILLYFYGNHLRHLLNQLKSIETKSEFVVNQTFTNIRTVAAYNALTHQINKYNESLALDEQKSFELGANIGVFNALNEITNGIVLLLIFGLGNQLIVGGEMSHGNLLSYLITTQNAQKSIISFGVLYTNIVRGMDTANRIFQHIQPLPNDTGIHINNAYFNNATGLEFKNISFAYGSTDRNVLDNVSLVLPLGKTIAICGKSGCGKSTLMNLIERFSTPTIGSIVVNGIDISNINLCDYRNQLAYVPQEPTLFESSVIENIQFGRDATLDEIVNAACAAHANEFIESFSNGYDTIVSGTTLSGGQKQRIAIARALLKRPSVLLLDEPTSALDSESSAAITETLNSLSKSKDRPTIVIIAHRLETIEKADLIVVMDKGRVVQVGTHDDLVKQRGFYYKMIKSVANE